jgi:biotin carboxylase
VRRVLILAPTTAYQVDDLSRASRRLGLEPLLGTDRCHVLAEDWPEGALALDFRDPARAADQAIAGMDGAPVAGVVATDEKTALIAGLVAERLGLRHAPALAAAIASDKRRFRERMGEAGLPQPGFEVVEVGGDPRPAAARLGYPVVVKPLHLSASRGVIRADDDEQLTARCARLARLLADPEVVAVNPEAAGRFLVERFISGPEVALEGLMVAGALRVLAIFDKPDPLDGPFFAETIYVTPSRHPAAPIISAVAAAAAAIGLDEGPVHAEVRLGEVPIVLELAARSIGGLCGRVLRFGAGIALEEVVIAHAAGLDAGVLERSGSPAGGDMMLPFADEGVLAAIDGIDQALAEPGIRDLVVTARIGDHVLPLPEGRAYAGFLFADGDSPESVTAALRRAAARLRFQVARLL